CSKPVQVSSDDIQRNSRTSIFYEVGGGITVRTVALPWTDVRYIEQVLSEDDAGIHRREWRDQAWLIEDIDSETYEIHCQITLTSYHSDLRQERRTELFVLSRSCLQVRLRFP